MIFLGPVLPIPPDEGGGPRRGNNNTNNNNNDTMASPRGPSATIAPRAVQLILSGIPLSLTIGPLLGDKREGDMPLKYP